MYIDHGFTLNQILLVDDEPSICSSLQAYLEDAGYQITIAHNGQEALDYISFSAPDLVILDLSMPAMDGHELLKRLSGSHPDMPKLVLSGVGDIATAMQTIHEGAWDFIAKPIVDLNSLQHKITMIEDKAGLLLENRCYQQNLERLVNEKTADNRRLCQEIIETQKAVIRKLGDVIETRSSETGNHVRRVALMSRLLALKYGLTPEEAEQLNMASPMHDLGKVGIPDRILMKQGKLNDEEFAEIKTHTMIGYNMLKNAHQPIFQTAAIVALQHHEYWDGSGYPQGLRGEDIHIFGRITCLIDVYDALRQKRLYKDAWPSEKVLEFIREKSGLMFDPQLVELFFQSITEIEEIICIIDQDEAAG